VREVDRSRLLAQRGCAGESPAGPGDASTAPSPVERPRLLAGLALGSDEACCSVKACVLEAGKAERSFERIRLPDLVRELWPLEQRVEGLCRSIRTLNDSSRQDFLLQVSRRAVWVRTDFVRAVVEPNRCTLLDCGHPIFQSFLDEFTRSVRRSWEHEDAFGCWAVECIICAAVTLHNLRLQVLKPVVDSILDNIKQETFNSILQLYPLKMALSSFCERLRPLEQGLRKAVQIEGEGEELDGGRRRGNSDGYLNSPSGTCLSFGSGSRHEDGGSAVFFCPLLEEALYNWTTSAEEIMADAAFLGARIEDTMRFLEAWMSCTRNKLLMFELWTMVATVAIGLGALISGVFGMNLNNFGFDSQPGMFWAVSVAIGMLMLAIVVLSMAVIARSMRHYNTHAPRFGNNRFFRRIDDDDYVLSLASSLPSGSGPRLQLLLAELRAPALPQQEETALGLCRRRAAAPLRPADKRSLLELTASGQELH